MNWTLILLGTLAVILAYTSVSNARTCSVRQYEKRTRQTCRTSWWRRRCSTSYYSTAVTKQVCCSGYSGSPPSCRDINECAARYCQHSCVNTQGSYNCNCNRGYRLNSDRRTCSDIDECRSSSTNNCQQNCVNTAGSFRCSCSAGYKLNSDGRTCSDIDECSTTHACNHICSNTVGSYRCSCKDGFSLIPGSTTTCQGEYAYKLCYRSVKKTTYSRCGIFGWGRCSRVSYTRQSYTCKAGCKSGYTGDNCATATCAFTCLNGGSCVGPNTCSCQTGYKPPKCESVCKDHECDHTCVASGNSYICRCNAGYTLHSDGRKCVDLDECKSSSTNNCQQNCVNTQGSFKCSCRAGYKLNSDGRTCSDIDECSTTHACNHICSNTVGSYRCSCKDGFSLLPGSTTTCQGEYAYKLCYRSVKKTSYSSCGFWGLGRCSRVSYTRGSYSCKAGCKSGYSGDNCATATCDGALTCPNGGTCIGPNTCSCRTGYKLPNCESVCKDHRCDHTCVASGNSYICQCNTGYILQSDGRSCVASNPCTISNGRCDHTCKYTRPGKHVCSCRSGYALSYDGRSCYDINECTTLPCDHICKNSLGSYSCACKSGYTASQNGARCTVNSMTNVSTFFLFTDTVLKKIYKMDFKTKVYHELPFTNLSNPIAVDWDNKTGLVFWTDVGNKRIYRGLLDGSQQQIIRLLSFYAVPDGIAVDSSRRLLFYSNTYADVIARMDFRGHNHKNIIYNVTEPRAIVLDSANEMMYWTDWGAIPKIEKSKYDGSGRTVLVSDDIRWPNGLALDLKDDRLFWADASTKNIEFVKLDGSGRTKIYTSTNAHFFDIFALGNNLYFSDWKRNGLRYLQKDGRNLLDFGPSAFGRINGLFLYDDGQNDDQDPTDSGPKACNEGEMCMDFDEEGSVEAGIDGVSILYDFSGKTSKDCSRRAVFKVTFDQSSSNELCHTGTYGHQQMLKVDVFLHQGQRSGWLLNIGDSIGNNGYAGDAGQSDMSHELQILNGYITSYASTFEDRISEDCKAQRMWTDNFVNENVTQVTFYIANNYFLVRNDAGQEYELCHKCLFGLDGRYDYRAGKTAADTNIYIGVNRVISSSSRNGYGTCSMKMSWVEGPPSSGGSGSEDEPGDEPGSDSISNSDSASNSDSVSDSDSGSGSDSGPDSSGTSSSDSGSSGTSSSDSGSSGTSSSDSGSSGTSSSDSGSSGTSSSDSGSSGTSSSDSGSSGTSSSDSGSSGTSSSDSGSSGTSDSDSGSSGTSDSDSGSSGTSSSDSGSSGTSSSDSGSSGTSSSDSGSSGTSDSDSGSSGTSDSDSGSSGTSSSDSGSSGTSSSDSGSSGTSSSDSGSSGTSDSDSGSSGTSSSDSGSSGTSSSDSGSSGTSSSDSGSSGTSSSDSGSSGTSDSDSGSSGTSSSDSSSSGTSSGGSSSSGTSSSDSGSSGTSDSDSGSSGTSDSDSGSSGTSDSDSGSSGTSSSDSGSSGTSDSDSGSSGTSSSDSSSSGTSDSDSGSSGTSSSDSSSSGTSGSDSGSSGISDSDSDSSGTSDSDSGSSGTSSSDPDNSETSSSDSTGDGTSSSNSSGSGTSSGGSSSSGTSSSGSGGSGSGSDGSASDSDWTGSGSDWTGSGSGSSGSGSGSGGSGSGSSGLDGDGSGSEGDGSGSEGEGSGSEGDGSGSEGDGSGSEGDGSGSEGDGSGSEGDGSGSEGDGSGSEGDGSGSEGDGSGSGSYGDDSSCNGLTSCKEELLLSSLIVSNTDCQDYCQCKETSVLGITQHVWKRFTCGAGHRWNGESRYCDLQDRYQCTGDSTLEPGDSDPECLGTCTGPDDENKLAGRNNTGCAQFCLCVKEPDNTYRWQTLFCQHGSLWASAEERCIGEYQMNCLGDGTGVYTPSDSSDDTGDDDDYSGTCDVEYCLEKQNKDLMLLPYSGCSKFCQCAPKETQEDGTIVYFWQVKECAPGAYWLPRTGQCGSYDPNACKVISVVGDVEDDTGVPTPAWKGPKVFNCSGVCTKEFHGSFTSQLLSNCTQYCHCTQKGNNPNYEWIPALCAPGTRFESNRKRCLHSDDVLCQDDGYGVYIGPLEDEPEETSNDESCPVGGCSAITSGNVLVVKNTNCTKYCKCFPYTVDEIGNLEYRWVVQNCSEGEAFNVTSSTCETVTPDICSEDSTNAEDGYCDGRCTQAEWGSLDVSKDPDCRSFCHCAPLNNDPAFYWQVINCGTNTRFSLNDSTCVHENNVNCTGADDSGSGSGTEGSCPVDSCKYVQNLNLMALPGSDCKKFCQCAPLRTYLNETVEYTWVVKDCAPGTRWNNVTGNCGSFDEETYECIDSTSSVGGQSFNDGCPDSCGVGEEGDFIEAVDSTCVSYCQCAPRHNGGYYWQKMYCAPGTKFDKDRRLCLFPSEVTCDGGA